MFVRECVAGVNTDRSLYRVRWVVVTRILIVRPFTSVNRSANSDFGWIKSVSAAVVTR